MGQSKVEISNFKIKGVLWKGMDSKDKKGYQDIRKDFEKFRPILKEKDDFQHFTHTHIANFNFSID